MAKTRQVLHFCDYGKEYKVIRCNIDEYKIYHIYNDYNKSGFLTKHRKLEATYHSLWLCFNWFVEHNIGY